MKNISSHHGVFPTYQKIKNSLLILVQILALSQPLIYSATSWLMTASLTTTITAFIFGLVSTMSFILLISHYPINCFKDYRINKVIPKLFPDLTSILPIAVILFLSIDYYLNSLWF